MNRREAIRMIARGAGALTLTACAPGVIEGPKKELPAVPDDHEKREEVPAGSFDTPTTIILEGRTIFMENRDITENRNPELNRDVYDAITKIENAIKTDGAKFDIHPAEVDVRRLMLTTTGTHGAVEMTDIHPPENFKNKKRRYVVTGHRILVIFSDPKYELGKTEDPEKSMALYSFAADESGKTQVTEEISPIEMRVADAVRTVMGTISPTDGCLRFVYMSHNHIWGYCYDPKNKNIAPAKLKDSLINIPTVQFVSRGLFYGWLKQKDGAMFDAEAFLDQTEGDIKPVYGENEAEATNFNIFKAKELIRPENPILALTVETEKKNWGINMRMKICGVGQNGEKWTVMTGKEINIDEADKAWRDFGLNLRTKELLASTNTLEKNRDWDTVGATFLPPVELFRSSASNGEGELFKGWDMDKYALATKLAIAGFEIPGKNTELAAANHRIINLTNAKIRFSLEIGMINSNTVVNLNDEWQKAVMKGQTSWAVGGISPEEYMQLILQNGNTTESWLARHESAEAARVAEPTGWVTTSEEIRPEFMENGFPIYEKTGGSIKPHEMVRIYGATFIRVLADGARIYINDSGQSYFMNRENKPQLVTPETAFFKIPVLMVSTPPNKILGLFDQYNSTGYWVPFNDKSLVFSNFEGNDLLLISQHPIKE